MGHSGSSPLRRWIAAGAAAACLTAVPFSAAQADRSSPEWQAGSSPGGHAGIEHLVYIIFDNVHDSDIAQMPHLMAFLRQGTYFSNDHTVLISHTQDGMLSDLTGQYPDKTGVLDQSYLAAGKPAGFLYWTSPDPDGKPHVTTTPPWKIFNQHGFDVGAVGAPDMELENAGEAAAVIQPQVDSHPEDYLGIAVHRADGSTVFGSPNLSYLFNAPSWTDPSKHLGGFPGWGKGGADPHWSLQATYEMQTHGVPVTFTYLHDVHEVNGQQKPPGQYDSVIRMYDQAFDQFFKKLDQAGINPGNTLFVLTTDEGDHYMPRGERSTDLGAWLAKASGIPAGDIQYIPDSGAPVYLKNPADLPKALSAMKQVPGWDKIAGPAAMKALHMAPLSAPARTPSFVVFAQPDVWYSPQHSGDGTQWVTDQRYLWNHGTIAPDILHTWMAMVGPGVKKNHVSKQWLDHTDTMPTVYALMGFDLKEGNFDGLPAVDGLSPQVLPRGGAQKIPELLAVENLYKQLNAPVGIFGMTVLNLSTQAALHATDPEGAALERQIADLTAQRERMVADLRAAFDTLWNGSASQVGHPAGVPSAKAHEAVETGGKMRTSPTAIRSAIDAAKQFLTELEKQS